MLKMTHNIDTDKLEFKLNQRFSFRNEFEVSDDNQFVLYVGEANVYFDSLNVRGNACLLKYNLRYANTKRIKEIKLIPPRLKLEDVKIRIVGNLIWEFCTESNYTYFLLSGRTYKGDGSYRNAITGNAANSNIGLSKRVFDLVFGPIDERIMQMYQEVKNI